MWADVNRKGVRDAEQGRDGRDGPETSAVPVWSEPSGGECGVRELPVQQDGIGDETDGQHDDEQLQRGCPFGGGACETDEEVWG